MRADFALCDPDRQAEGHALVAEVQRSRHQLLPADQAYVEALAARDFAAAVQALQKATWADPSHHRASSAYLMARLVSGQFAEARRHAELMRLTSPDDPLANFADLWVTLFADGRGAALAKIEQRPPKPGDEDRLDRLRAYFDKLGRLLDAFRQKNMGAVVKTLRDRQNTLPDLRQSAGPIMQPLAIGGPTMNLFFDMLDALAKANAQAIIGQHEEALQTLSDASARHPEPLLLEYAAALRLAKAAPRLNRADLDAARRELREIGGLYERATAAPTLFPQCPIHHKARIVGAIADLALLKITTEPEPAVLERLRDNFRTLVVDGRRWREERQEGISLVVTLLTAELSAAQGSVWPLNAPGGAQRYADRVRLLADLSQSVLNDWQLDEPTNRAPRQEAERVRQWVESVEKLPK
jgi:hypothetical protein